jgi:hypothetical protein
MIEGGKVHSVKLLEEDSGQMREKGEKVHNGRDS